MLRLRYSNVLRRSTVPLRPGTVTAKRLGSGSSIHDDDPNVLEVEKRRNLSKQQHRTSTTHEEHAPGWNEYLASSSEAHVKADRHGEDGPPTIELAERTIKHVKKRHHDNGFLASSREEASYERDEVEGPLKTSSAGNTERDEVEGPLKTSSAGNTESVLYDDFEKNATQSEKAVKADRGDV